MVTACCKPAGELAWQGCRAATLSACTLPPPPGVAWVPAGFLAVVFGLLAALLLLPRPWNWTFVALNLATVLMPLRWPPPRWAARFLRFSVAESRRCESANTASCRCGPSDARACRVWQSGLLPPLHCA